MKSLLSFFAITLALSLWQHTLWRRSTLVLRRKRQKERKLVHDFLVSKISEIVFPFNQGTIRLSFNYPSLDLDWSEGVQSDRYTLRETAGVILLMITVTYTEEGDSIWCELLSEEVSEGNLILNLFSTVEIVRQKLTTYMTTVKRFDN